MLLNLSKTHKTEAMATDKAAPMPAGPIVYRPDGGVDWANMWDSFCVLAQDGGPPHRGDMLLAPENPDTTTTSYHFAVAEIVRGVWEVAELEAAIAEPGWMQIQCKSEGHARWLAQAIEDENVQARYEGSKLFVPVGDTFQLKKEVKNVITAVAKTTHYWEEHLAIEVKQALAFQESIERMWYKVRKIFAKK